MTDIPELIDNRYNNAISALTYGFNCLVYHSKTNKLYDCILSIHEQYINILHIIVSKQISYLLQLHEIYNITDNEYSTQSKLKEFGINHYLILYTQSLQSFTFAFKTQYEKQQLKIAMIMFVREAKLYYDRLNQFDPFKAQAMMTFLHADKDGGNLLDIEEIQNILKEMKIQKIKEQIQNDILQIDHYLYDREKLKRPKDMTNTELNELGFQYLLRYYSIKDDIAKYFTTYCPMFKLKNRSQKNLIVDIVRYNQKPLMSASQLKDFYEKVLCSNKTQEQCLATIKSFPVYDGEGKEKLEEHDMISFNNFCSLISSRRNSAFMEEKKECYQKMNLPLSDYYVYSDFSDYSLLKSKTSAKINFYQLALKRGCRCIRMYIEPSKEGHPVVRLDADNPANLQQILKIIAAKAFEFNSFPLILKINTTNCNKQQLNIIAKHITIIFQELLFVLPSNFQENDALPYPAQLSKKILLMADVNMKLLKAKEKDFPEESMAFFKIISIFGTKLDFQRKGQFCWNYCNLELDKIKKFQDVQDQNLSNYTKKIIVKTGPQIQKGIQINPLSSIYLRMGVQLIGLSFNYINEENYILQSLFLQNGGAKCGYISKPQWMCLKNPKTQYAKNFDTPMFLLNVKVVSGQNCIVNEYEPGGNYYLQMYLRGNKKQQQSNQKYTSAKQNSGYYSKFGIQGQFSIYCLDLATLVLLVRAQKTKTILSGRAIPIRHLQQGLRPVFLLGQHFKQSVSSYVFIHSKKKEIPKKTHNYFQTKAT